MSDSPIEPSPACPLCPRLAEFRNGNRGTYPDYFNAPVPSFGSLEAPLLIVGLAPGLHGANKTGRPFTGDYAGDLLSATLRKLGLARGTYARHADDGFELAGVRVTNAVRCVPPQNKPTPAEIAACRRFLVGRLAALPRLRAVVCLGRIAHESLLRAQGARLASHPFAHGARHDLAGLAVFDSYHCSRYNTNTRRLTSEMFETVVAEIRRHLDALTPAAT
jgi:uracil-DNA glycosylase family 4